MENKKILTDEELLIHDSLPFTQVKYEYVKSFGLITSFVLSYLISKHNFFEKNNLLNENGEFYRTLENIADDLGIGSKQVIQRIIAKLNKDGFLEIKRRGIPPRNYYKLNYTKIISFVLKNRIKPSNIITETKDISGNNSKSISGNNFKTIDDNIDNYNKEFIKKKYYKEKYSSKEEYINFPPSEKPSSLKRRNNRTKIFMTQDKRKNFIEENEEKYTITENAKKIIDYWNSLGLKKITDKAIKSKKQISKTIAKLTRGTLFNNDRELQENNKSFKIDEIKQAIWNFNLAISDENYLPYKKQKMYLSKIGLSDFLYNPFATKHKSLFLIYLKKPELINQENKPKDEIQEIKDMQVYSILSKFYKENVLGSNKLELNNKDTMHLTLATNKIIDFFEKKRDMINPLLIRSRKDIVEMFCETMKMTVENEHDGDWTKLTPGYFSSEITFTRRFPSYLNSQAIIMPDNGGHTFSIYNKLKGSEDETDF